ncbi:MAG: winged helix-turn-helix transcriptional regulator [Candidatus Aenigmatarchaeota archaeon]
MGKKGGVLGVLSNKYSYGMLKAMEGGPKRFKDFSSACPGEKMRAQRLKEFEELDLLKVKVERIGRRPVSIYELSETGKKTLRLAEGMLSLQG